jgi:tetratricopeptide (TPR) repeat protein
VVLAAALLTKETAILVPVVIVFLYFMLRCRPRLAITVVALDIALIVIWLFVRQSVIALPRIQLAILLSNLPAVLTGAAKCLLPLNLIPIEVLRDTDWIPVVIGISLLAAAVLWPKKRRAKQLFLGAFWYLLFILPSLTVQFGPTAAVLECRYYTPLLGMFIILSGTQFPGYTIRLRGNRMFPVAVAALAAMVPMSVLSSLPYASSVACWNRVVRVAPGYAVGYVKVGHIFQLDDKDAMAEGEFRNALRIDAMVPEAHYYLGEIISKRGQLDSAEVEFSAELMLHPDNAKAWFKLAAFQFDRGNVDRALSMLHRATMINPSYVAAWATLGNIAASRSDRETAEMCARQLLDLHAPIPDYLREYLTAPH